MTPEQRSELLKRVSHCESAFHTEETDWRCAGHGAPERYRENLVEYVDSIVGAHVQREAELTAELQLKCNPAEIATQVPDGWRLVPAEPNEAMLKKGELAYWQKERDMCSPTPTEEPGIGAAGYCYLAMLSAAPQPAPEEPSPVDPLAELTAMSQELGVGYAEDDSMTPPSTCRQRLIAEGKPYARSTCAVCGHLSPKWKECDAAIAKERQP